MGSVVSFFLYPLAVAFLQIWRWTMIRDADGNEMGNAHLKLQFDDMQSGNARHWRPVSDDMIMKSLDPESGIAAFHWEDGEEVGKATGFHHFDFDGTHLRYSPDRHHWNPNGTFSIQRPASAKRGLDSVNVGGTWVLISDEEASAFEREIYAAAQAMGVAV